MADEDLERLAREEILKETKRASARADEIGPQGWTKCPIPSTNKRFLQNTIMGTLSQSTSRKRKEPSKRTSHDKRTKSCEVHPSDVNTSNTNTKRGKRHRDQSHSRSPNVTTKNYKTSPKSDRKARKSRNTRQTDKAN